jgi:hypothetical protein
VALVPQSGTVPCAIDQVIKGDDVEDELEHQTGIEFLVRCEVVGVVGVVGSAQPL